MNVTNEIGRISVMRFFEIKIVRPFFMAHPVFADWALKFKIRRRDT